MVRKTEVTKRAERVTLPKVPFCLSDNGAFLRKSWVAVESVGRGALFNCLFYSFAYGNVDATLVDAKDIRLVWNKGRGQFSVDGDHVMGGPTRLAETHLQWLKNQALKGGATPEAVRLLKAVTKVTKKEEEEMAKAEKLRKKTQKSGDETPTPVGKGGKVAKAKGGKGKGNPEALKKAREARAANAGAPDVRRIKILNKENPYREDSNRAASFNALKGAKTVEDYKSAGGKVKYLSRWAGEGRISLG
jgi:hypothetical protein